VRLLWHKEAGWQPPSNAIVNGLEVIVLQMAGGALVLLKEPHVGEATVCVIEKFYFYLP